MISVEIELVILDGKKSINLLKFLNVWGVYINTQFRVTLIILHLNYIFIQILYEYFYTTLYKILYIEFGKLCKYKNLEIGIAKIWSLEMIKKGKQKYELWLYELLYYYIIVLYCYELFYYYYIIIWIIYI